MLCVSLTTLADDNGCTAPTDKITFERITQTITKCQTTLQDAIQFNQIDKKSQVLSTIKQLELMLVLSNQLLEPKSLSELRQAGKSMQEAEDTINTEQAEQKYKFLAMKNIHDMKDTAKTERLIPVWRDATFTYQFYAGVEYGEVGEFFDESKIRLGFQSYVRLADDFTEMRKKAKAGNKDVDGFGLYYPHLIGNIVLTGAAESQAQVSEDVAEAMPEQDDENNTVDFDALEFEAAIYFPIYTSLSNINSIADYRELTAGIILAVGGRKVEDLPSFSDRYYAGLRISHNEETYFDLLYGKSEPLKGKRLELRGQLPVASLGTGRVFLGGIANIEISRNNSSSADEPLLKEEDSFKVYVTWQTSFSDLFKSLTPSN